MLDGECCLRPLPPRPLLSLFYHLLQAKGLDFMEEACSFFFFKTPPTTTVVIFGRADYVPAANV